MNVVFSHLVDMLFIRPNAHQYFVDDIELCTIYDDE